jgi:predicted phosphodiesterase
MRYAIISDIHGNLTALNAVLEDCKNQKIDRYLFLGDYYGDFPMQNEVVMKIREFDNSYALKGNKEERLVYFKNNPDGLMSEQFAPLKWNINNISKDTYEYIRILSDKITFTDDGICCFMAHSSHQHFGRGVLDTFTGEMYVRRFGKDYSDHAGYLKFIDGELRDDEAFIKQISDMPEGVYLFGHYHTQWYASVGGKLLINPGSCGMPFDFDTAAPYTILDASDDLKVVERRIPYDMTVPIKALRESDFFTAAPFWHKLSIIGFENARDELIFFFNFVEDLAQKKNDSSRPYSNELWREATLLYDVAGRLELNAD